MQVSGGGKAKYDAKRHALVWKFKKFPGESEASLTASVDLIATTKEKRQWARPPIQLQFQVRAGDLFATTQFMNPQSCSPPANAFVGLIIRDSDYVGCDAF